MRDTILESQSHSLVRPHHLCAAHLSRTGSPPPKQRAENHGPLLLGQLAGAAKYRYSCSVLRSHVPTLLTRVARELVGAAQIRGVG